MKSTASEPGLKRSTDYGAKSRPDGEDFLSANQVCISRQTSIVYLRVLKDSRKKIEFN